MASLHDTFGRSWLNANPFHFSGDLTMSTFGKLQCSVAHVRQGRFWAASNLTNSSLEKYAAVHPGSAVNPKSIHTAE